MQQFVFNETKPSNAKYRGNSTTLHVKMGFSRFFNFQIELIELIEGDCIFKEFLDAGQEGLHHFGIFVDEITPIKEEFLNKGIKLSTKGVHLSIT